MCIRDRSGLLSQLGVSADGIYTLASSAGSDLSQIQKALETSSELLKTAASKTTDTTSRLGQMEATGDFSELEDLISGDKDSISSFLAAPDVYKRQVHNHVRFLEDNHILP